MLSCSGCLTETHSVFIDSHSQERAGRAGDAGGRQGRREGWREGEREAERDEKNLKSLVPAAWLKDTSKELMPYTPTRMDRVGNFRECALYAQLLRALFRASNGRLIKQKKFYSQFYRFIQEYGFDIKAADAATYRIRLMMKHMHDAKGDEKTFEGDLGELMDSISIESSSTSSCSIGTAAGAVKKSCAPKPAQVADTSSSDEGDISEPSGYNSPRP